MPEFSVIIPFLNEEQVLPKLRERLCGLSAFERDTEFIFVSDGSTDGSVALIEDWLATDSRVRLVVLTRNFGHQAAVSAGLSASRGAWVGIIDADLQDSPEELIKLFETAKAERADVVYAVRVKRKENAMKRAAYASFYMVYRLLADTPVQLDSGDFSVMSRRFVDQLLALPESVRFVRALRSWIGMKQIGVKVERAERAGGEPQYSLSRLFSLAMLGLTGFSVKPLRLSSLLGFVICGISAIAGIYYLVRSLTTDVQGEVPGFATTILVLLFLHGLTFLLLGIIGEYIAQIFLEVKRRPTYLVEREVDGASPTADTQER